MKYDLVRPCNNCPFRTDGVKYLRGARAEEIAHSLLEGAEFPCHKTTVDTGLGSDRTTTWDSQFCAGALIMLEREGQPNQMMRIAERVGRYDPARLDMDAPVGRVNDFLGRHEEGYEGEPCSVADYDCLAPAGYMVGGVAVRSEVEEGATEECEGCGAWTCENCQCECAG